MSSFSEWFSNFFDNLFSSSSSTSEYDNSSQHKRVTPRKKNLTYDDTVNTDLTKGLYHNSVSGYKLGGSLCYNPIKIPLSFMGVPHFSLENEDSGFWADMIDSYNKRMIQTKKNIQTICHRDGTVIIYPIYNSKSGKVELKNIPIASVYRVLVDTFSDKVTAIITKESITYYDNKYSPKMYEEQVTYTETNTVFKRTGTLPEDKPRFEDRVNPVRGLPIIFTNQKEFDEFEGHSDYERIIPLIKAYSEVNQSAHETLINLSPKLIQEVNEVQKWLKNNGMTDINDIDINTIDFIINKSDAEKTEFVIPNGVVDGHVTIMKRDFQNIVEASGIPEIAWGLKTEGNHASAEEQVGILLSFVRDKQEQANVPYYELYKRILELESIANMRAAPEDLRIVWNDLDTMSETERSEIFKNYADGIGVLVGNAGIDLESIHNMLYDFSNGKITNNFDEFKKNVIAHGVLKSEIEVGDPEGLRLSEDNTDE